MKFSQRMGKKPVKSEIQIESMDDELRASLWNCFRVNFLDIFAPPDLAEIMVRPRSHGHVNLGNLEAFLRTIWADFFKQPLDTLPNDFELAADKIREWFFKAEWYEVYDLLEFIAQVTSPQGESEFTQCCNQVFERELSGYRFMGTQITPVTDKVETSEIEGSLTATQKPSLTGVHSHLRNALSKLSDRKNPDYRNSIKESISAVEAIVQVIAAKPNVTLGDALTLIENSIGLHPALKKGFMAIYGYTSDADGIRHAMLEESKCDFADAKYMLVSCSAFINYLIMKSVKTGRVL